MKEKNHRKNTHPGWIQSAVDSRVRFFGDTLEDHPMTGRMWLINPMVCFRPLSVIHKAFYSPNI